MGLKTWKDTIKAAAVVVVVAFGIFVALMGNNAGNPVIIVLGICIFIAGGYLGLSKLQGFELFTSKRHGKTGDRETVKDANCLVIYEDLIAFEKIENPPDCLAEEFENDGKLYYVLIQNGNESKTPFVPPDISEKDRHFLPTDWAEVMSMLKVKKYLNYSNEFPKQIAVGIMAFIIIGEIVGLIAIGG